MRVDVKIPGLRGELLAEFLLDELGGLPIEITIPERGRVQGIEQLREIADIKVDGCGAAGVVSAPMTEPCKLREGHGTSL